MFLEYGFSVGALEEKEELLDFTLRQRCLKNHLPFAPLVPATVWVGVKTEENHGRRENMRNVGSDHL